MQRTERFFLSLFNVFIKLKTEKFSLSSNEFQFWLQIYRNWWRHWRVEIYPKFKWKLRQRRFFCFIGSNIFSITKCHNETACYNDSVISVVAFRCIVSVQSYSAGQLLLSRPKVQITNLAHQERNSSIQRNQLNLERRKQKFITHNKCRSLSCHHIASMLWLFFIVPI
jgi:hypothetical protein